jgi:predicted membrane-bound mannosyltransferase/sugar lactone lactonase YvrE
MDEHEQTEELDENRVQAFWEKRWPLTPELGFYLLLLLFAFFTRFYDLDSRVMSHDESLHTQFSWYLAEGRGFSHDPLMHGPLQMHLVAFSYFLFGDSDASARVPAALSGVLAVAMVLLFRRWLGRWGTAAAAFMMAFSPYMLYYSRYVRNDVLITPMALLMFYAVFRYIEQPRPRWLYILAASLALHITAKETAFIYTAQLLIFLGVVFAATALRRPWREPRHRLLFISGLGAAAVGGFMAVGALFSGWAASGELAASAPQLSEGLTGEVAISPFVSVGLIIALVGVALMLVGLLFSFGRGLRTEFPALDLVIVTWTMTMPQLAALLAKVLGWDALDYSSISPLNRTLVLVLLLLGLSAVIGLLWDARKWLIAAGVFFGIYIIFYTTLFTNQDGLASGLVGSLGYWLKQHGVERGGQPWYYYLLIQIPIYEYLPAIGALLATWYLLLKKNPIASTPSEEPAVRKFPAVAFFGYWSVTALVAYSFAGEKMPWLTVHIALPLILYGGWGIGKFLEQVDWRLFTKQQGWLITGLLAATLIAALHALGSLLGASPPFQGSELDQLRATLGFLGALVFSFGSGYALWWLTRGSSWQLLMRGFGAIVLVGLLGLTVRTSLRASFPNADLATEYLVYAHGAPGVKTAMNQIEDLSIRMTDGLGIQVAFDDDVSWPLNWYLRDYPNQYYFGASPTRELLNYPVILVGDNNWHLVEPLLGGQYYSFEYIRMWWPNQDYWSLKRSSIESELAFNAGQDGAPGRVSTGQYLAKAWEHIKPFFTSREVRAAIFDIWLNRDFKQYGQITGKDMNLPRWSPSDRMRLYIRKDIAAQVWDYGVTAADFQAPTLEDPYADRLLELEPTLVLGREGVSPGEFFQPRDLALGSNGEVYVADTGNHRIEKFSPEGELLTTWGGFANAALGDAPGGTFNEPWGIAVGPTGDVFVADTWNHRVQWFSPDGEFKGMLGTEGLGQGEDAFWGPRDVAVDAEGRIFVADTGNKSIKVYNAQGAFLAQFGGAGYLPGSLDEPVGLAIDGSGRIYVADTWNRRIQVFEDFGQADFQSVATWDIDGWYGQSLENKPFLSVNADGILCGSDPEGLRVLCFDANGEFQFGWGGTLGADASQFSLLSGIGLDDAGSAWVVDSGNQRVMRFQLPSAP